MSVLTMKNEFKDVANKDHGGFTLIELMIAVAIISITAGLAVPSYLQWNARYQLRQAATQITNQLTLARMTAMNRNRSVNVNLTKALGMVSVGATDVAGNQVIPAQSLMGNVNDVTVGTITFSSLGLRMSGTSGVNQQIQLTNSNGIVYSVRITPAGKANWCASSVCT